MTLRLACLALACALAAPLARAHPVHTSHAELDYRAATARVEITLRFIGADLLRAVNAGRTTPLDYEKSPAAALDAALRDYALAHFRLADAHGASVALAWVGREADHEDDHQRVWLYFEAALPGGLDGARVLHDGLCDEIPRQQNTVRVRDGRREVTLAFAAGAPPQVIRLPR